MTKLVWDKVGERNYETGVDHGALFIPDNTGRYTNGVAWNGLTTVTESPSGAESNPQYADNIKYVNLQSAEEFGATIEALTYPDEFLQFDGAVEVVSGVVVGQQNRGSFGLSYRTLKGNDLKGTDLGYKIHLVYGCQASPSEKAYTTVNDSPEALAFSWELSTTAVPVNRVVNGRTLKATATLTVDSTDVDPAKLAAFEEILYGTADTQPRMPLPDEVFDLFEAAVPTEVEPQAPAFDQATNTVTIPNKAGVVYTIDDETVPPGPVVITTDTLVVARPAAGYKFPAVTDSDWLFTYEA